MFAVARAVQHRPALRDVQQTAVQSAAAIHTHMDRTDCNGDADWLERQHRQDNCRENKREKQMEMQSKHFEGMNKFPQYLVRIEEEIWSNTPHTALAEFLHPYEKMICETKNQTGFNLKLKM